VAAGLLAGCGTSAVEPRTWAKSVCSALDPWRTRVADLTGQAQQEITKSATPSQTRQSLVTLLGGAEQASDEARQRVVDAGVPDVDGGEKAAGKFVTALTRARDAYGRTKTIISELDVSRDKTFYDAVDAAFRKLNQEYSASALRIDTVGPAPLHKAFDEVPECQ
jgi:hypothetical protein